MKTWKDLCKNIRVEEEIRDESVVMESEDAPWGQQTRSAHNDYGIHRTEQPSQIHKLNGVLHAFFREEVACPNTAMAVLKNKLNFSGLDFANRTEKLKLGEGSYSMSLNRFGGTFGTSPTHNLLKDGFEVTDGTNGHPLTLHVHVSPSKTGLYQMTAHIASSNASPSYSLGEEVEQEESVDEQIDRLLEEYERDSLGQYDEDNI